MPRPLALRPEPRDAGGVRATLVETSTTAARWLVVLAVAGTPTADLYTPDCDHVPFPVPAGGALEGETGYHVCQRRRLPPGVRFRLRADDPLASLPSEGARVIARAMQRYGMILSDGGNIALTAQSDRFTTHKWTEVGVDSHSLTAIQVTDMEVVGMGATIPLTYDCVRTP